jgi:ferrous-iron efflux pump FieF
MSKDTHPKSLFPSATAPERQRLLRFSSLASIGVAGTLILAKLVTWMLTDSVGMLASLADSLLDLLASGITFWAIRAAAAPPDQEHRFGHGKAEPIAALSQAGFVVGTSVLVAIQALHQLTAPSPLAYVNVGMGVMLLAIVLTLGLLALQKWVYQKTHSIALKADSMHYQSDLLINIAVLLALLITQQTGLLWVDGVLGLAISLLLLRSAWHIGRGAVDMLMDRELPEVERQLIIDTLTKQTGIVSWHDLKTRMAGPDRFIQLHLELDGNLSLFQAHQLADAVELQLRQQFPQAEILIHQDPAGVEQL